MHHLHGAQKFAAAGLVQQGAAIFGEGKSAILPPFASLRRRDRQKNSSPITGSIAERSMQYNWRFYLATKSGSS